MVGSRLFDDSPSKKEWVSTGENAGTLVDLETNAAGHVLELTGFLLDVVSSAACFDVLIVGSALEQHMAFGKYVSGVCFVSRLISRNGVNAIVNFYIAIESVNLAVLLLMLSAYRDGRGRVICVRWGSRF